MKVALVISTISRAGGGVSEAAKLQMLATKSECIIEIHTFEHENDALDSRDWQGARVVFHKLINKGRYGVSWSLLWSLLRSDVDLIHAHGIWQFPCLAVHIWSLVTRRPYVVTPHGMLEPWILTRSRTLKKIVSFLYQDSFLRRAAAFQVLTAKERLDVAPYVAGQIIAEIPNYVLPAPATAARPQWWRPEIKDLDIYLFLGRIHGKKGCMELLDAWALLCDRDPEFQGRSVLVFCGWIDGLNDFEAKVAELASHYGNLIYAGPQYGQDKISSILAASFFVLPSKSEGLPMAVLEAWSAAVPVIMTDECNLSDGFSEGAAIRTEVSPATIAKSLHDASKLSTTEREEMGSRGKALAQRQYSQERVGAALINLYKACVAQER
jgi:glycosyltransferase involved in cell wall biosynthesis